MPIKSLPTLLGATLLVTSLLTPEAESRPSFVNTWRSLYPNSATLDNVLNGTGTACQGCHTNPSGNDPWNAYGWRIREALQNGASVTNAILQAESFDSDNDPTGSTNLAEILAGTQPGWTDGANNTTYFENGGTQSNQPPPSGILGLLDPSTGLGTSYCGPANTNSSGLAGTISATGSATASDNDVTLVASQLPTNQFGYFLNSLSQGFVANPGGSQGNLCLGSGIGRYTGPGQVLNAGAAGSFSLAVDLANTPTPGGPVSILAGQTWNFQCWFRDVNPTTTSNFTDGLSVDFL